MKNGNAHIIERQPSVGELTIAIATVCSYDITDEQREIARLTQYCGSAIKITVTQDFDKLAKSE